ncbi:hypothetical protein PSC71_14585 [Devosia sp. J2-20]|uniref:hypothetical protein n=1 Tax=Devosia sp. J2-20 TaxID=3026161 RepID=UPI00249C3709|nr:hypothetical protein [Devosia sp. J2-20]WDQ98435.1 hypothetical protein PSC71_14585 [Devosia sp. J2-20]
MDFGGSLGEVWRQGKIPVVLRRTGPGERLRLRIPLALSPGYSWLEKLGRHHPMWSGAPTYYWEVPKSWFDDFVDAALRSFGKVYIIQPYREHEVCAYNCRHAKGHECQCSCMGANHGSEHDEGWFDVTEAFAVKAGERQLACRLLQAKRS